MFSQNNDLANTDQYARHVGYGGQVDSVYYSSGGNGEDKSLIMSLKCENGQVVRIDINKAALRFRIFATDGSTVLINKTISFS